MGKAFLKISLITLLLVVGFTVSAASVPPPDLVPQGCQTGCPCSLCDLYTLGRNIVNFLLYGIAIPVAAVAILYGGVMMLISAGDPKKITDGKSAISSAVIGIAITFFAWVIINALLSTVFFQIGFVQGMLDWNKPPTCTAGGGESCNTTLEPANPIGPPQTPPVTCGQDPFVCDPTETVENCAIDCDKPGVCGNKSCEGPAEDPTSCPRDCGGGGSLSHADAVAQLAAAGISVVSTENCSNPNVSTCTSLEGMPQSAITEIINIKNNCSCTVTVTGGTETGHLEHGAGKAVVDLNDNPELWTYLQANKNRYRPIDEGDHFHVRL